jgi:hypothetical protein
MKTRKLIHIAAIALAFGVLAGLPTRAAALSFGGAYGLGYVNPPEPADPPSEQGYVNTLISFAAGSGMHANYLGSGYDYFRDAASCGSCPAAVFNSKVENPTVVNGKVTINLATGGFTYLLAKYDGPNGYSYVWNIQGLAGVITIPGDIFGRYGISHYSLFGPGGGGGVPDGGTTVMLLGAALGALGMARRYLFS